MNENKLCNFSQSFRSRGVSNKCYLEQAAAWSEIDLLVNETKVSSIIPNESLVKPFGSNDFIFDRILSDYSDEVALIMIIDGKLEFVIEVTFEWNVRMTQSSIFRRLCTDTVRLITYESSLVITA